MRQAQPARVEFSQETWVKYALAGATLATVALLVYLSWGKWVELFNTAVAPLVILAACFRWRRRLSAWALVPALLQALFGLFNTRILLLFPFTDVRTYDLYLFFVDGSFGFEPSILARHMVDRIPFLFGFIYGVYQCLPLAMALAYVAHLGKGTRTSYIPLVFGFALAGTLIYKVLPACGPIYFLGRGFTGDCGVLCSDTRAITVDINAYSFDLEWPRNAMPSLHVTWALLTFWVCRDLRRGRWIAGAFLICTALATLVMGEHYLVDVIVAFPLALVTWQLCVGEGPFNHPHRVLTILGGGLMLLLWVSAIRFDPQVFWLSPILPWSVSILTVGCSLWAVSRHPHEAAMGMGHGTRLQQEHGEAGSQPS
jgi:hypothetical protein